MLHYTGHPLIDVGIATIAVHANRTRIEDVTEADLAAVADDLEREYVINPLRSFLTVAFTSNAWFVQDAYNPDRPELSDEQRSERRVTRHNWATAHLRQWNVPAENDERCVFTGLPAIKERLSGSLSPGRAARAQIPLMQGDDTINFFPNGNPGVPISGLALLALQIFPLGSAKVGRGLLTVHSDNPALIQGFVNIFHANNLRTIAHAKGAGTEKIAGASRSLQTLLIETLLTIEAKRGSAQRAKQPSSITAYNINNGKTPSLDIYYLPSDIVGFVLGAAGPLHRITWDSLVQRAWQREPPRRRGKGPSAPFEPRRNFLYDDVFTLPLQASRFIRRYFLRMPHLRGGIDDPRTHYRLSEEYQLVSWGLVDLFLRRILVMEKARIEQLRSLGDKLAVYVGQSGGKKFFRMFATEQRPSIFRQQLILANERHVRNGNVPLFTFDDYIEVFEDGFDLPRSDWRLARDLVLIRMIEQLRDWLRAHPEALPEDDELALVEE